jgi:hypothetical protein
MNNTSFADSTSYSGPVFGIPYSRLDSIRRLYNYLAITSTLIEYFNILYNLLQGINGEKINEPIMSFLKVEVPHSPMSR